MNDGTVSDVKNFRKSCKAGYSAKYKNIKGESNATLDGSTACGIKHAQSGQLAVHQEAIFDATHEDHSKAGHQKVFSVFYAAGNKEQEVLQHYGGNSETFLRHLQRTQSSST
jgi:hypothetical protein